MYIDRHGNLPGLGLDGAAWAIGMGHDLATPRSHVGEHILADLIRSKGFDGEHGKIRCGSSIFGRTR